MKALQAAYCAFVLSIPFETILYIKNEDQGRSGVSISKILGVVLFGLALAHRRACFNRAPAAFWLCAWYLGAYALSQLWVPSQMDPWFREQQFTLVQLALLFLVSVNLFADADFRRGVLRIFGWGVCLMAAAMLLGAFGAPLSAEGRSTILSQNANLTASLFGFGAICIAGDPRLLEPDRRLGRALLSAAAVAVLAVAILRTGSRGGLLAFAGGIVALAACGGKATRGARAATAAVVLGLLGLFVRLEFQNSTATAARLERSWTQGDTAGRDGIYEAAWAMFLERPLLGYGGANNHFVLGTQLNASGRSGRSADRDTHNVFLAVLTEVGLVGGVPFIAALLLAAWLGWRGGRRTGDAVPFALMCSLLIINTSTTGFRQKIFWVVLAAAVACGSRRPRSALVSEVRA